MLVNIFKKTQVEKDEGPEAETLLNILIVTKGPD